MALAPQKSASGFNSSQSLSWDGQGVFHGKVWRIIGQFVKVAVNNNGLHLELLSTSILSFYNSFLPCFGGLWEDGCCHFAMLW